MTTYIDENKPLTEERYLTATDASNLRVEADRRSDADILIAAAWSGYNIGTTLMRLHTKPDRQALELVQVQVAMHAVKIGVEYPDAVAAAVLSWWLRRTCRACSGRRKEVITGTPILSKTDCRACSGLGEAKLPYGSEGRALVTWLDRCKQMAVEGIKQRLRPSRKIVAPSP